MTTTDSYDVFSPEARSKLMSKIGGRNTGPEMKVRSLLHKAGYRFRLHVKDLPGKPDIVLPRYHAVILVHGCFWHGHDCAKGRSRPKTRAEFWAKKIKGNQERDQRNCLELESLGWRVITVWECELKEPSVVLNRLKREIGNQST